MMRNLVDKYLYVCKKPFGIRIIYALTFLTWILFCVGMSRFFRINFFYFIIFFPIFLPLLYNRSVSYFVNIFYPYFSIKKHEEKIKKYWEQSKYPSVDIFLPICGESMSIIGRTWDAVKKIEYPNLKIYVLEDKIDSGARNLANQLDFNYLSRPNKQEFKKAGSLKYGYNNSQGEFVIIFDADFMPHKDFIKDLLPYMEDPNIGIVQSPQYFTTDKHVHSRSKIEYGAGNVVEDFYRIVEPSRNLFGAAICVGTNAIYRRKAIFDSDAPKLVERSEDVITGLALLKHNYKLEYIPLVLACGICPNDIEGYFKQHNRWCTGSVMLLFSRFFWGVKMNVVQRIIFTSGPMYYIAESMSLPLSLLPFLLLYFNFDMLSLSNQVWFLPYVIMKRLVLPMRRLNRPKKGTTLAAVTHIYTYVYSLATIILKCQLAWVPTNIKRKNVSKNFMLTVKINHAFLYLYVILLFLVIIRKPLIFFNINSYILLFWIFYSSFFINGYFAWNAFKEIKQAKLQYAVNLRTSMLTAWRCTNSITPE